MIDNFDFEPPADPWALFAEWYALAEKKEPNDPNAMGLATVGADGMPSIRIVLLKGHDPNGFVFFTNKQSRKGRDIALAPLAAVNFYWKSIQRQIRAEGYVSPINDAESDAYFASRPRASQIGAWASQQSQVMANREELEQNIRDFEKLYEGENVPRPPYWGGYRLRPVAIEFWQEKPFRLHDRVVYRRGEKDTVWRHERLYP